MGIILTEDRTAFRRYETAHERKFEWQCRRSEPTAPLYPRAIGYSRWDAGALQVRRSHPGFSVEILLAGSLVHYSAGNRLRLRPGDVLLKQTGSAYRLRPGPGSFCHKVHVALDGTALPVLLDCWGLGGGRALRFASVAALRSAVSSLSAAVAAGRPSTEWGAACYHLLAVLAQGRPRRPRPPALAAAQAHIRRHLDAPLAVADIAAQVGLSPSRLHRLFRTHLRSSPIEYALRLRLERAAELLDGDAGLLIKQVARCCGFSDQRYFARVFKHRYGMTPRQWRRRQDASVARE